jgi:hypothetical protein
MLEVNPPQIINAGGTLLPTFSVLNYRSFDFFNSKFDGSPYSKKFVQTFFINKASHNMHIIFSNKKSGQI